MPVDCRERLADARLYLVCPEIADDRLDAALRGGVDIVQLRMKSASDGQILTAAERFRTLAHARGALFIVNDRADLAVAAGADGVHLGQDDLDVQTARAIVGPDLLIGSSTHSALQIDAGQRAGVDYLGVGPVHPTPTKPGRPAVGTELVSYAAAHCELPWFAIGGIASDTLEAVVEAGATRVAVVRALTEAADPEAAARGLKAALELPIGHA